MENDFPIAYASRTHTQLTSFVENILSNIWYKFRQQKSTNYDANSIIFNDISKLVADVQQNLLI